MHVDIKRIVMAKSTQLLRIFVKSTGNLPNTASAPTLLAKKPKNEGFPTVLSPSYKSIFLAAQAHLIFITIPETIPEVRSASEWHPFLIINLANSSLTPSENGYSTYPYQIMKKERKTFTKLSRCPVVVRTRE